MELQPDQGQGLSRREVMKRGLRAGAYAAPVVLASAVGAPVTAQRAVSMPTPTTAPTPTVPPTPIPVSLASNVASIPLGGSFTITGAGYPPNTTVYLVLLNIGTGRFTFVAVTASATGAIGPTVFNTVTNALIAAIGPSQYAVLSTLSMPTATTFTGELVRVNVLVTPATCVQQITYFQDFTLTGVAPTATYNVFYRLSNSAMFIQAPFQIKPDAFGVGGIVFPLTVDTSMVTSVTLVATINGQPGSTPTNPVGPPVVSNIVTALACTNGGASAPGTLAAAVLQEPTNCPGNPAATNYLDVGLFNATPNTAYDIYLRPNTTGVFTLAASRLTTNGQGNATAFVTFPASAILATSYTVSAVLTGTPVSPASFTTSAQLPSSPILCPAAIAARVEDYKNVQGYALTRP